MKKLNLLYLLICTLIFGACKDDTFGNYGDYSEGEPAMLVGSIKVPSHQKIASRAMGAERETAIEQLAIIAWEINSGRKMAIDLTDKVQNESWTSEGASVYKLTESIPVKTGRYRAYFIANWKSFYGRKESAGTELTFDELQNMTEDEIKQICFWNYGGHIELYGNDGFPMTQVIDATANGGHGFEITKGDNELKDIFLERATAHIHFKIYNGNQGIEDQTQHVKYAAGNEPEFVPVRYAVYRAPSHTNAFEEGKDNVNILKANTFDNGYHIITAQPDQTDETYYDFDFHMLENRQPVIEGLNSIADRERWNHNSTNPNVELGKESLAYSEREFTNAPEGATFVVIEGTYSGPVDKDENGEYTNSKYIGNVTYIVHLGNFNTSGTTPNNGHIGNSGDFSVLRNELQEISIHVQGANTIKVNVEVTSPDDNPAVEGDLSQQPVAYLDAHYAKVMLEIPRNAIKSNLEENTVAITSYKNGFTNTEYKLEQLENATLGIDYKWVQFQKPGTDLNVFPQYAGKDHHTEANKRTDRNTDTYYGYITDLIHDLSDYVGGRDTNLEYAVANGDNFLVAAFVDDNVYKDTQNEIKAWAGVNVLDRRIALNPDHRLVSENGTSILSGVTAINIRQKPVISTYSLGQSSFPGYNPFGLEQVQEPSATIESLEKGIRPKVYGTATEMSTGRDSTYLIDHKEMYNKNCFWWDSPITYDDEDALYVTNEELTPQKNTRTLFPDFDKEKGVSDDYTTFYKKASNGSYEFVPAEDYITTTKALVVHNRDLNGNGYIEGDELQWYVPGYVQLLIFNYGSNLIPETLRLQQRADEIKIAANYPGVTDFDRVFSRYLTSSSGIRRLYWHEQNGASSFLSRPGIDGYSSHWMPQLNHIRFARSLGTFEGADTARYTYMSQHNYAGDASHVNNIRYLNANISRTFNVTELYPFHYVTDEFNRLPAALEYNPEELQLWNNSSDGGSEWPIKNLRKTVYTNGVLDLEAGARASQEAIYKRVIEKYQEKYNVTISDGRLPDGWRVPNQRELLSMFVVKVPYTSLGSSLSSYRNAEFLSCTFVIPDLYTERYNMPILLSGGVITLASDYARPEGYVILVRDVDPFTGEPITDSKAVEYSGRVGRGILKR